MRQTHVAQSTFDNTCSLIT